MESIEIRNLVLEREKAKYDKIMALCNSPIELKLLSNLYWFFIKHDYPIMFEWIDVHNHPNQKDIKLKSIWDLYHSGKEISVEIINDPLAKWPVFLCGININCSYVWYRVFPQFPVYDNLQVRYTDFVIEVRDSSYNHVGDFVIECDGFQWHSTKEQLERDNTRNRFLTKHGYKIIRYTGSELNAIDEKFIMRLENEIYHSIFKKESFLYEMLNY